MNHGILVATNWLKGVFSVFHFLVLVQKSAQLFTTEISLAYKRFGIIYLNNIRLFETRVGDD